MVVVVAMDSNGCWLKRGSTTLVDSNVRRGGFKAGSGGQQWSLVEERFHDVC